MTTATVGPIHIVGAGPGVGAAVARRFGRAGHSIGLIARDRQKLIAVSQGLSAEGFDVTYCAADATNPDAVDHALTTLAERQGTPRVLTFSPHPNIDLIKPVLDTTAQDLGSALALSVVGVAAAVQNVLPAMLESGNGSLLFVTGSAVMNPTPTRAVSAVSGFAEKAYLELLASAVADRPVHAAHLVVVGSVGVGLKHDPDDVAERLWRLHDEATDTFAVMP
ncbi:SDR family NAD(P)-dependent oxidoreductase [Rhodococcus opacus]|uniref:SDR family NAD(P)-dependent oxidoreductase n=1 Tax=Rhodococcus opacus TaxID=37919 RepID=UPI001C45AA2A|nr:SDR family NAD(P)-dependent oxidoreductase [Rhodococcus opacus]MBV6756715.1 SDR family NAD(P)-dependent oxidoreductase [Rhodococcus opacus]